jgi:Kef-type K+ transport system membrane component KefB
MPRVEPTAPLPGGLPADLRYVALLFALFVVPRILQRFRIAAALTSLALGAGSAMALGWFVHDPTVALLSTFGIVALFLFAGLELDVAELRRGGRVLVEHLALRALVLAGVAWAAHRALGLDPRPATLVALALLTPSTGFILDSLASFGFDQRETFWVRSKAIATELLALAVLFVTVQSDSAQRLALSGAALVGMIAVLPVVFQVFARWVVPHAPRSEFAFVLMIAVVCAIVTRELGVYYLVGAFVVGMTAWRFRTRLPSIASADLVRSVELFASFFVPFYFFHAGLELTADDFSPGAFALGAVFLALALPLRLLMVVGHRGVSLRESPRAGFRIALALSPTLVFTLVLAQILRDRFGVPREVFGGLILYTLVNTVLPGLLLRQPPPEYERPHVAPPEEASPEPAPTPSAPSGAPRS